MTGLTQREGDVLAAIDAFTREHRYSPTVREIGALVDVASSETVHAHLQGLRRLGLVTWVDRRPRTLVITDAGAGALKAAA